jgi:hypothetical protein
MFGLKVFDGHRGFSHIVKLFPWDKRFFTPTGVFHPEKGVHMHVILCMVALHIGLSTLAVCYPGLPEIS